MLVILRIIKERAMAGHPLVDASGAAIDAQRLESFLTSFRGRVFRHGDSEYDAARQIWNASIDKHPGLIARCSGLADVIDAVRFARANGLLVAIRGGGHNVGGRALCDDGLVIDLSGMKGIHVDPKARRARVQPGVLLGELDRETHVFGLAAATGVVSKTGVAGLTLGGGVGWLARKYGLACDNVISFEMVTADGEVLQVSADEHPDLFWALRGGGGNFGVVTSFEYRLHPVKMILGGLVVHARDSARDLLRFYRSFTQSAPDELATYAALLHTPDGMPAAGIVTCYCGDLAEGERVIAPLRGFGRPLMDMIQPMPFPVMQTVFDAAVPDGHHNYWKSSFLRELSDEAIDVIVRYANEASSPLSAVLIEQYGGAASRVGVHDTAFAQRQTQYDLGILSQWTDPAESARHVKWARDFWEAMSGHGSGAYLLNFLGEESDATIKAAFGANYDRLVEVKTAYDPTNFFRVNQNLQPKPVALA
jgi:FAD/FMN-containing dehydrogenase